MVGIRGTPTSGFEVSGLWFGVSGFGIKVSGVSGFQGFRVSGFQGFRYKALGVGV